MKMKMKIKYLNQHQVQEALRCARKTGRKKLRRRNYLIIKTLVESGLRVSELISLIPKNIDYFNDYINIQGKGGKIRQVDIPHSLTELLEMYSDSNKIKPKNPIFPLTRDAVHKITKKCAGHGPHALRHTFALFTLEKTDKDLRFVQKQLGHSRLDTTEIYLSIIDSRQSKSKISSGLYDGM